VMPREVTKFIQGRFGELRMSESKYGDLLSKANEHYLKCLNHLKNSLCERIVLGSV
jgi:intergrase/recombinase